MSEKGISYRQSWLEQVLAGKASTDHPETKLLLSKDSLLDATLILYDECRQQLTTDHVTKFVAKYKNAVSEIRHARIVRNDFQVLDLVGRGQFGKVELARARHGPGNTVYALKTIPKKVATDPSLAMSVWEERDILTQANSPWLTQAYYTFQDEANLYLVMEYLPGGDLFSLMRRQEDLFTEENVRFYFVEILLAVHAVHHMGYVHRDIKPENILFDQRGHVKLVDFGSSVRIGRPAGGHCIGTASYMSPEVLRAADPDFSYTFAPEVDYWALGIVLYEMLYYRNPFVSDEEVESSIEVIRNILNWQQSLAFDDEIFQISDVCRSLIENLITDRERRFGFKEVTGHPFLGSIVLSQIGEMTPPFIPHVSGDDDTSNFEPPAPGSSFTDERHTRSSFAGGDNLSQVAFLGYTYSSMALQTRKPRARASLAMDGAPVSALERKWADRANELRARCHELEARVFELEEEVQRSKLSPVVELESEATKVKGDVTEKGQDRAAHEDVKRGKDNSPKVASAPASAVSSETDNPTVEATNSVTSEGFPAATSLRQENTKLKCLIAELNVEIEEQRSRVRMFKAAVARHAESEAKSRERNRDLETRLRALNRRRSLQSRRADDAMADEHRQMLTTIREQNDAIAQLEMSKHSMRQELEESKRVNETLQAELRNFSTMSTTPSKKEVETEDSQPYSDPAATSWGEVAEKKLVTMEMPLTPRSASGKQLAPATPKDASHGEQYLAVTSTPMFRVAALNESLFERDRVFTELTHRVADLLAELNTARCEIKEAEKRCHVKEAEMRAAIESHESKLAGVNEEKRVLKNKYERMCIEKIEKYDENRELKKMISDLKSRAESLQGELDQLHLSEANARDANDEATEKIRALETEVRDLASSNERLRTENEKISEALRILRQGQEHSESDWKRREQKLTEDLAAARQQLSAAQEEARSRKVALSESNALLASSRQRERSAREAASDAGRRLDEMRARLCDAERSASEQTASAALAVEREQALKHVRWQLEQESTSLKAAESALQETNAKLENFTVRNEMLQDRVKELGDVEQKCKNLEKELSRCRQQQRTAEDKCENLELKLQQMTNQFESERSTNVDKRAKDAADASHKLNDLRSRLRGEAMEAKNRCGELESKVAKINIEASKLSRDKQNLEEKVETLSKRAKASEEEAMRLKEECAQHITTIQHLRRENLDLQRDLDAAEDSFDAVSAAKTALEAQLQAQAHEFGVERLRSNSTIQQQGKLIDMLKGNVENVGHGKKKGIKHLFGGNSSRPHLSGASVSTTTLQALQSNRSQSNSPGKSQRGRESRP